jgi:fatty acid desaturase
MRTIGQRILELVLSLLVLVSSANLQHPHHANPQIPQRRLELNRQRVLAPTHRRGPRAPAPISPRRRVGQAPVGHGGLSPKRRQPQ